jgi:prephenate dehydratase
VAAERYGAVVLREGVEDEPGNETRFVWLGGPGSAPPEDPGPWKTSLVFWGTGADAPGWLVRCLSEFAFRGVNLVRIESRPLRQGLGRYLFFVDLEGRDTEAGVEAAIAGLGGQAEHVRVLGSYPAA